MDGWKSLSQNERQSSALHVDMFIYFETRAQQRRPAVENRGQILHFVTPVKFCEEWAKYLSEFHEFIWVQISEILLMGRHLADRGR